MSLYVDSITDYLERTTGVINANRPYTLSMWAYIAWVMPWGTLFMFGATSYLDSDYLQVGNDPYQFVLGVSGTEYTGVNSFTDRWFHIGIVRESETLLRFYLNGTQDIEVGASVASRTTITTMRIGNQIGQTNPPYLQFDKIKLWSVALNSSQLQREMYSAVPVRKDNLYGFYPCIGGSGVRALDFSGNGRHWTEAGTIDNADPAPVPWKITKPERLIFPVPQGFKTAVRPRG